MVWQLKSSISLTCGSKILPHLGKETAFLVTSVLKVKSEKLKGGKSHILGDHTKFQIFQL